MAASLPLSSRFVQSILDALSAHIAVLSEDGVIVTVNRAWRDFGVANALRDPNFLVGGSYLEVCERAEGEGADVARAAARGIRAVMRGKRPEFELEYPCHSRLEQRWFVLRATAFENQGSRWTVLAHENITARKKAELEQVRLAAELRHRVKNTVAVVQSIARQTIGGDAPAADAAATFHARLNALARAHALLTEAGRTALNIEAVVEGALEPFRARDPELVRVGGPEAMLAAQTASTLTLVLHELATNAAKYGALSVPGGRVEVMWTTSGSAGAQPLSLTWQEIGGPDVEPQPRRGFGSLMIERSIAHELGGSARLEFLPGGVRCSLVLPDAAAAGAQRRD